jgi:putative transposase
VLPRIGRVRLHEAAAALAGLLATGEARVLAATVRYERGRWHVSFSVEQTATVVRPPAGEPDAVVGVDLGVKTLAVLSTGEHVPNPRHLATAQRKVRRLSRQMARRQGPDQRPGQRPSNRWKRTSAALAKAHGKVADQRRDSRHKLTTMLASSYGTVVVEDLNVAGMVKNRRLARAVSDAGFGQIRRQVEYKTSWRAGRTIVADRWYASSKTCSGCGAAKAKLLLSRRVYVCVACGLVKDRDDNASLNLAEYGRQVIAASGAEIGNGRGADRKTGLAQQVAVKRQPGSVVTTRQTGTVPTQEGTAA